MISGIIEITSGMLSITADRIAAPHRITIMVNAKLPLVSSTIPCPSIVKTPLISSAPTIMKRPQKNKMVFHSTFSSI